MPDTPPQFVSVYSDTGRGGYVWMCPVCKEPQVTLSERVKNLDLTCHACKRKFVGKVLK